MTVIQVECRKPARLAELEAVIARGLDTFVEVGLALMEIREQRLYRESHKTFEAYCRERWGWNRDYANKHIRAAQVAQILDTNVSKPANEAVARELTPLADTPDVMREVWFETVEEHGPAPTAAEVREVVAPRLAVKVEEEAVRRAAPLSQSERSAAVKAWDEKQQVFGAEGKAASADEHLQVLEQIARRNGSKVASKYVLKMLTKVEARCRRIRTLLEATT